MLTRWLYASTGAGGDLDLWKCNQFIPDYNR